MKAKKGVLNRANIAHATGKGKRYVDKALLGAKKLSTDEDRMERLEKCLCLSCFYLFKERIGGAAITHRECASCDKEMQFSSTATDLLCLSCATNNSLCSRCGADIELKERRKPMPIRIRKVIIRAASYGLFCFTLLLTLEAWLLPIISNINDPLHYVWKTTLVFGLVFSGVVLIITNRITKNFIEE